MDKFIEIKENKNMTETTRQVLNKAIDLLHKLSNKKIEKDFVKQEFSSILSNYYMRVSPNRDGIDENYKLKLELFLDRSYEVINKIDSSQVPLYEGIMLINKVVMSLKDSDEKKEVKERPFESIKLRPKKIDDDIVEKNENTEINSLMGSIFNHKKEMEKSISHLNDMLYDFGFELRNRND